MRRQRWWTLAATIGMGATLAACGGPPPGPGSDQNGGASSSTSGSGTGSTSLADGSSGIPIGVLPVENTPVASAQAQPAMFPSPSQAPAPAPAPPAPTRTWYVSQGGSDTAEGSQGAPFQTIGKALTVVGPGERISVAAGTYAEDLDIGQGVKAGQSGAPITLEGEGSPKIVPGGGSGSALLRVAQPYWVIDGFDIDVQGQPKYGVAFSGNTQGDVLANSTLHDGSLGGGVTTADGAQGVTIENNEISKFVKPGADSHGVVIQPSSKKITVRNNDIHDTSGDAVQCIGPEGFSNLPPADGVTIEQNDLHDTQENAVDIKTCWNVTIRHNRMHDFHANSYAPDGTIAVIHMSAKDVTFEGNELYDGGKGIALGGNHQGPVPTNVVIQKNLIHDLAEGNTQEGTAIRIENSSGAQVRNNTFTALQGPALILGHGTGGPTQNLTVENNVIDDGVALSLGTEAPGLKMDHNLYRAGGTFQTPDGKVDLAGWQKQSQDAASKDVGTPVTDPHKLTPDGAAVDQGLDVGLPFCGSAPDEGAVETGC